MCRYPRECVWEINSDQVAGKNPQVVAKGKSLNEVNDAPFGSPDAPYGILLWRLERCEYFVCALHWLRYTNSVTTRKNRWRFDWKGRMSVV